MNNIDTSKPEIPRFENADQAVEWSAGHVATWNDAKRRVSAGLLGLEIAKSSLVQLYGKQEHFKVDGFLEKGGYNSPEWEAFMSEGERLEDERFGARSKVLDARKEMATLDANGSEIVDANLDLFIEVAAREARSNGVVINL